METITKIPGLQHISEDIFKLLDGKSLMNCKVTNSSWKNILEPSIFWLKKLKREGWKALAKNIEDQKLAKDFARCFVEFNVNEMECIAPSVQSKWIALLHELENIHQPKDFVLILIKICNNRSRLLPLGVVVCLKYANKYPDLVESILENENPTSTVKCIIQFNDKLMDRLNSTSIHLAALYGLRGVVEKLSKKYDDPIVKTACGINAIHLAALNGDLNIVKHLMEFADTPLAPDNLGWTPIHFAVANGNLDTVKFLVGLTNTPNILDNLRMTLIELAEFYENVEVQKFLENYIK